MNLELIYMMVLVKSSSGKAMDVSQDNIKVQAWNLVPSSLENEEITGNSNKERCLDI